MNLEIDGTKKILLVEESQGLTLHTDSQKVAVAIGGVSVQGPQGEKGDTGAAGAQGVIGLVAADYPIIYQQGAGFGGKITPDIGTADGQFVVGGDYRLTNQRVPIDASVTDVKISGTLNQSKITNLTSDLSTLVTNVNGKAPLVHTHAITDITSLSSTLTGKQNTSEKNQANGYVGLDSTGKIDSSYLPIQRSTLIERANSDSEFTTKASQSRFQIGDKLIKTGESNPAQGTYLRTNVVNGGWNSNPLSSDWLLEAVGGGISEIQTVPGGPKIGALVTISYTDIGAAPTSHTHTLSQITDVGNSASKNTGTTSGTVAAGDDSRIIGAVQKSSNLNDLTDKPAAIVNLGLGDSATKNVGTLSNQIAAGAHPHVFRTSHNFIIQGNIVTSGALAIPPFFAVLGFPLTSAINQNVGTTSLVKIYYKTGSGVVSFQIVKSSVPYTSSSNLTINPSGADSTKLSASASAQSIDLSLYPITINDADQIQLNIPNGGISGSPQNFTVTLVFEHRLN